MRRLTLGLGLLAVCGFVLVTAKPTFGQDGGTVSTTVSVPAPPAPCITLDKTSINYGTVDFSPGPNLSGARNGWVDVTSCSTSSESVLARGTNAVGSGTGAWTLNPAFAQVLVNADDCSAVSLNEFSHNLVAPAGYFPATLSTSNSLATTLLGTKQDGTSLSSSCPASVVAAPARP